MKTDSSRFLLFLIILLLHFSIEQVSIDDAPKIVTDDGNLIFQTAQQKSIRFETHSTGQIRLNDIDLTALSNDIKQIKSSIDQVKQLNKCNCELLNSQQANNIREISNLKTALTSSVDQITRLSNKITSFQEKLSQDECLNNPCHNGGQCIDGYDTFKCICPNNYQGRHCTEDVNECQGLAGTIHGCQNNARCENTIGGFRCICVGKWSGVLCNIPLNNCANSSNIELCGHGTCIPDHSVSNPKPFKCICESGWTLDPITKTCIRDLDECNSGKYPCSTNPYVQCINTPGDVRCGECPPGFEGNGYNCQDIDECANSQACGINEQCINSFGSFKCQCIDGMRRNVNGICERENICNTNNGGCSPNARCAMNNFVLEGRICTCNSGFIGNGIGLYGCTSETQTNGTNTSYRYCIRRQLCRNGGTCQPTATGFTCQCLPNFTGERCRVAIINQCIQNPCQNGGRCEFLTPNNYRCHCQVYFTGANCEIEHTECGGTYVSPQDDLEISLLISPSSQSSSRSYRFPCMWTIVASTDQFLQVKPMSLQLRGVCSEEYVQLKERSHLSGITTNLGRYCQESNSSPVSYNTSSSVLIISSKLRSGISQDHGFQLKIIPTKIHIEDLQCCLCVNSSFVKTHQANGLFQSPHFPIKYSASDNCVMEYERPYGEKYKVELNIRTIDLGDRISNCSDSDYLRIILTDKVHITITACNQQNYYNKILITSGFIIQFHADFRPDVNPARFQIRWTKSLLEEPCGGQISLTPVGTILGPPLSENEEAYCTWKANHTKKSKLLLFKGYFDNWVNGNCSVSFEILNVNSQSNNQSIFYTCQTSNMLGEFREQADGDLIFIFWKPRGFSTPGFRVTAEYTCGASVDMDQLSTYEFKSDNFPNNYAENLYCSYRFSAKTRKIAITFTDFDINDEYPCNSDYIELINTNRPRTRLCNGNKDELTPFNSHPQIPFMNIVFRTNGSISGQGFKAVATVFECGGFYYLKGKVMIGYPETYLNLSVYNSNHQYDVNRNCSWDIQSAPGTIMFAIFDHFHTEYHKDCLYDYVRLTYDNRTKMFCGNNAENIYTKSNRLRIQFVSDYSVPGEGFLMRLYSSRADSQCHDTFEANEGVISSPPFGSLPRPYLCYYFLKSSPGRKLLINITTSESDGPGIGNPFGGSCFGQTRLRIINGALGSTTIADVCPQSPQQGIIITSSNTATIIYFVPQYLSASEFNFTIVFSSIDEECGSIHDDDGGDIASPNYPLYAPKNTYCRWEIRNTPGKRIQISISHIRSGSVNETNTCDPRHPVIKIQSSRPDVDISCSDHLFQFYYFDDNSITVIFNNLDNAKYRFRLRYKKTCVIVLDALSGRIESSNNIFTYPYLCAWKLKSLRGSKIALQIDVLDLPPPVNGTCLSYVEITDSKGSVMRKRCGNQLPNMTLESSNLPITIVHYIDRRTPRDVLKAHKGLILEYQTEGCRREIFFDPQDEYTLPYKYGNIKSDKFPNSVSNIDCIWNFKTVLGYSVKLKFDVIELDNFVNCTEGPILKAWENEIKEENVVFEVCQRITEGSPLEFQASSHNLYLMFLSANDSNGGQRRFRGSFEFINSSCEYQITSPTGIIKSPNYPNPYPTNRRCQWLITVRKGMSVHLRFLDFQTENGICNYDHVELAYSINNEIITSQKLCGTPENVSSVIYESLSNQLLVKFRSDHSVTKRGFKAEFFEGCGGLRIASENSAFLLSPNYPHGYHLPDGICEWTIAANTSQTGTKIFFYFMGFEGNVNNLNCSVDNSLTIIDGLGESSSVLANLCSTRSYHPIVSSGPYLTVVLRSKTDHAIFKATYGTGSTACGGEFYLDDGIITSPFYPSAVNMEIDCIYIIRNSPGSELDLTFQEFSRENENAYILHDFIDIRNGSTDNSPMIGRFYTLYDLRNFTGNTKFKDSVFIRLRSQGGNYTNNIRFLAKYHINYPNFFLSDQGVLASPQFGHVYSQDTLITWNIEVETGDNIKVSFDKFSVGRKLANGECSRGKLTITDVNSLTKIFCGIDIPNEEKFASPITVTLAADGYRYPGFLLHWSVPENESYTKIGNCEYRIKAQNYEQILTSPNFPGYDTVNRNCTWTIWTDPEYSLELKMLNFTVEDSYDCKYDNFSVKFIGTKMLSSSFSYRYKKVFCGTPPLSVFNFSIEYFFSSIRIEYKVDEFDWFPGFKLSYKKKCYLQILNSPEGWLQNEEYPNAMTGIKSCVYVIKMKGKRNIMLNFTALSLPPMTNGKCENGHLMIRLKNTNNTYCGSTIPSSLTPLTTNSSTVIILLTGDYQRFSSYTGFQLQYSLQDIDKCGGTHHLSRPTDHQLINLPQTNGSQSYQFVECQWYITSPYGTKIQIDFLYLNIFGDCRESYLALYDGSTTLAPKIGGKNFCFQQNSLYTTRNNLVIIFRNTDRVPKFKLDVKIGTCGGILYRQQGYISSPNYPQNYPGKVECIWDIEVSSSMSVSINFLDLSLDGNCSNSNLTVLSLEGSDKRAVWSNCNETEWSLDIINNRVRIIFTTNTARTYRGFKMKYSTKVTHCGGKYTDSAMELQSKNYPRLLSFSFCSWTISTDISRRIVLRIKNLKMNLGCLSVYHKSLLTQEVQQRRLAMFCHKNIENVEIDTNVSFVLVLFYAVRGGSLSFSYDTNQPSLCGENIYPPLNDTGSIIIQNNSVVECNYVLHNYLEDEGTIAITSIYIRGIVCNVGTLVIKSAVYTEPDNYVIDSINTCSLNPNTVPFVSLGKEMYVVFIPGSNANLSNYAVTITYKYNKCGGILTEPSGEILSPNYPNKYPNYANCEWLLTAPKNMYIQLTIRTLNLENHSTCDYDNLYIRFGARFDSPVFKKYCGSQPVENETIIFHHNLMRLSFHSDLSVSKDGFYIEYAFIDSTDNCNGILYNNFGSIKSPNYPRPYPSNLRCNWTVVVSRGYQVQVTFVPPFDLENVQDNSCRYDSLRIYDSDSTTLLANLCGHIPPSSPILSSSNQMSLAFTTDFNHNLDGFHARYQPICGEILNKSKGQLVSPKDYHSVSIFLKCNYIIPYWENHFIAMRLLTNFKTCRLYDSQIEVYLEDRNGNYFLNRRVCGYTGVTEILHQRSVKLVFQTTMNSIRKDGFQLNYLHDENVKVLKNITTMYQLKTPLFPSPYHHNADLLWQFEAPSGYIFFIDISFLDVEPSIDCRYDYVAFYDNISTNITNQVQILCGNFLNMNNIRINSNLLTVHFVSDASHLLNHTGISAFVRPTPGPSLGCGGYINVTAEATGTISSLDKDNNGKYDNDLQCDWILTAPYGYALKLTFENGSVNMEKRVRNRCYYDSLTIFNGPTFASPVIQTLCGDDQVDPVTSENYEILVSFKTDFSVVGKGFRLTYTAVPSQNYVIQTATNTTKLLKSPDYPNDTPTDFRFMAKLNTQNQSDHIIIEVLDLQIRPSANCSLDRFIIQDVSLIYRNKKRIICKPINNPITFISSHDQVMVQYVIGPPENSVVTNKKFQLNYKLYDCNRTESAYSGTIMNVERHKRNKYNDNLYCNLTLKAPEPNLRFQFYFKSLFLERSPTCRYDYIQFVFGRPNEQTYTLPKICGHNLPASFISNSSQVSVIFATDQSINDEGYQITYVVNRDPQSKCGGEIEAESGVITSPGYGNNYYEAGQCVWQIAYIPDTLTWLKFTDLQMGNNTDTELACTSDSDFVKVTSGNQVKKFCGNMLPLTSFTSNINGYTVEYKSLSGGIGSGFRIIWETISVT